MAWKTLTDADGTVVQVDENESADLTDAVLYDATDSALLKASIISCTATLLDAAENGSVLNGRNAQDILDANGGTLTDVASEVTLTLALQPADNPISSTTIVAGEIEKHYLIVEWTWNDGALVRTGDQVYVIHVKKKPST